MAYEAGPLTALAIVIFANAYATTFLFSFVGFMVVDLGAAKNKNEAGYIAGYVTSAFFLGRSISAFFWGYIADRYGRKPVLLIALFSIVVCSVLFGLSNDVTIALVIRFIAGCLNGIVAVSKAMVAEFTSGEHTGMGMSIVTGMWALGLIMGPAISGITSSIPADVFDIVNQTKEDLHEDGNSLGYFESNPYMLPCIISSGVGLVGLITTALFLPETLGREARIREQGYTSVYSQDSMDEEMSDPTETHDIEAKKDREQSMGDTNGDNSGVLNRGFIICLFTYCLLSYSQIFIDDVIPLWALAEINRGGLNFGSHDVGTLLAFGGAFMLFSSMFIYPIISMKFRTTTIMICFCALSGILAIFEPIIVHGIADKEVSWATVVIINGVRVSVTMFAFNANFILTNNTISTEFRGRANGISMGVSSFCKTFGPASGALAFAWSIKTGENGELLHRSPFDWHFTFLFDGFLFFLCAAIVFFFMPRNLDNDGK